MAMAKKGSRVITIDDISYRYKVSQSTSNGKWREQRNELAIEMMALSKHDGFWEVMDITINITIQLDKHPISNLLVKIYTIIYDSPIGFEQFTQVTPSKIKNFIQLGLELGWSPFNKGDYRLDFEEEISDGNVVGIHLLKQ